MSAIAVKLRELLSNGHKTKRFMPGTIMDDSTAHASVLVAMYTANKSKVVMISN